MVDNDIIFLDKDHTLGEFDLDGCGLYPNVKFFLEEQIEKKRQLYVTTSAYEEGRVHLKDIEYLLSGYFGKDKIGVGDSLYVSPDGTLKKIIDDYAERMSFLPRDEQSRKMEEISSVSDRLFELLNDSLEKEALQKQINDFFKHWNGLIHRESKEEFVGSTRYKNPNINEYSNHIKDLYLAKRLISPVDYLNLRTVMVGDMGDDSTVNSDPETPLVIISDKVRNGDWKYVSFMIDRLFNDSKEKPFKVYDCIFNSLREVDSKGHRLYDLYGLKFNLKKLPNNARLIHCL